jgi:hypothetical protein
MRAALSKTTLEATQRWASAAARDQHSAAKKKVT